MSGPPILPIELERAIFELAFDYNKPRSNFKLCLVSRYAYAWLKPLIFRVFVLIRTKPLFPQITISPNNAYLQDICQHVSHMALERTQSKSRSEARILLEYCQNLEELFMCSPPIEARGIWSVMKRLHKLRRIGGLFRKITLKDISKAVWAPHLTHIFLEYYNPVECWHVNTKFLSILPSLTHLAILTSLEIDCIQLREGLASAQQLQVFAYYSFADEVGECPSLPQLYAEEVRCVVLHIDLFSPDVWINGTWGGGDMWRWAECVVFARQQGYFKSDGYQEYAIKVSFPWRDHLTEKGIEWYEANIDRLNIGLNLYA